MLDKEMAKVIASHLRVRKATLENSKNTEVLLQLDRAINLMDDIFRGDTIASLWSVEDVLSLTQDEDYDGDRVDTSDITLEQAREVLERTDRKHDATIGINWDVLQANLDFVQSE